MADQPNYWRRRGLLAWLLWPISLLFRALSFLRRQAYHHGLLKAYRAAVPIIVVGNITVGGSGKTPFVIALVRALSDRGVTCGVVSRGYGAAVRGVVEVRADSDARNVGDEPLLIHTHTKVAVFVAAKRAEAVRALLAKYPDTAVIICDDGLQHYALQRDMEIALLAADLGLGNAFLLPAGPLREPPSRLRTVDAVVVTGHSGYESIAVPTEKMWCARARSIGARNLLSGEMLLWSAIATMGEMYLMSSIARPQRLLAMLRTNGIEPQAVRFYPDHAVLDDKAIANAMIFTTQGWLLMTGKDAVKVMHWPERIKEKILVVDYSLDIPELLIARAYGVVKGMKKGGEK